VLWQDTTVSEVHLACIQRIFYWRDNLVKCSHAKIELCLSVASLSSLNSSRILIIVFYQILCTFSLPPKILTVHTISVRYFTRSFHRKCRYLLKLVIFILYGENKRFLATCNMAIVVSYIKKYLLGLCKMYLQLLQFCVLGLLNEIHFMSSCQLVT